MASDVLERKAYLFAKGLQMRRDFPAAIIGAGHSYYKKVDRSGPVALFNLSKKLRSKLVSIGELYSKKNGNTIGCCAEVNASNYILNQMLYLKLNEIEFSRAIRPRTMQTVPKCRNCRETFI